MPVAPRRTPTIDPRARAASRMACILDLRILSSLSFVNGDVINFDRDPLTHTPEAFRTFIVSYGRYMTVTKPLDLLRIAFVTVM